VLKKQTLGLDLACAIELSKAGRVPEPNSATGHSLQADKRLYKSVLRDLEYLTWPPSGVRQMFKGKSFGSRRDTLPELDNCKGEYSVGKRVSPTARDAVPICDSTASHKTKLGEWAVEKLFAREAFIRV